MINILLKIIMSMGIKKAVTLLLLLAKIITLKTKTTKDDEIVLILIEVWETIEPSLPNTLRKAYRTGLK